MKYLLPLILLISLLSFISADTTFSDNPNYFFVGNDTIITPQPPTPPTGGGSAGFYVARNVANATNTTINRIAEDITQTIDEAFDWRFITTIIFIVGIFLIFRQLRKKPKDNLIGQ